MGKSGSRRPAGSIRKLPSGRWQARIHTDLGERLTLGSYPTKADADRAIAAAQTDRSRGDWVDPRHGRVLFEDYAKEWLAQRVDLRPRTRVLYEGQLRLHLLPSLGQLALSDITTRVVRSWYAKILGAGDLSPVTVSKCYRLLHAIMATATEDDLIPKNPCTLKGASKEVSAERPVATIEEVWKLANEIHERYRAMVLCATFLTMRLGELIALRRHRVDLARGTVAIVEQCSEIGDGSRTVGPPKTQAGIRTVTIPAALIRELEAHLERYANPAPDGLVFPGPQGGYINRGIWYAKWKSAVEATGLTHLHFHDLRHTGNTLAASTGASTKELMTRMGHASPRAALIYQHATRERDAAIAQALSGMIERLR